MEGNPLRELSGFPFSAMEGNPQALGRDSLYLKGVGIYYEPLARRLATKGILLKESASPNEYLSRAGFAAAVIDSMAIHIRTRLVWYKHQPESSMFHFHTKRFV